MSALAQAIDYFHHTAPRRPYCTNDPASGQGVRNQAEAFLHSHIQPNTPSKVTWLCFDCDQPGAALHWDSVSAPPPTLVMENPANGHAHIAYALETPVPRTDAARFKPLLYLASVNEGIRRKLDADPGYRAGLIKTPGHEKWRTTAYGGIYDLHHLAEYVTLPSPSEVLRKAKNPEYAGLGRNCMLFEMLKQYAYTAVRRHWQPNGLESFSNELELHAEGLNREYNHRDPLTLKECRSVAKSVARWVWKRFTPQEFRARQSALGAKKGAAKRADLLERVKWLSAMGQSVREIAAEIGVARSTVSDWLARA